MINKETPPPKKGHCFFSGTKAVLRLYQADKLQMRQLDKLTA